MLSPSTQPPYSPQTNDKNTPSFKRGVIVLSILLILICISNVIYWFVKRPVSADTAQQQVAQAVTEQQSTYSELESRYHAATAQLDSLKAVLPALEQKISEQQQALDAQKAQITAKIAQGDYAGAQRSIEELTRQKEAFILEIARLKEQVSSLRSEVGTVHSEKNALEKAYAQLDQKLREEQESKTTLLQEKQAAEAARQAAQRQIESQRFVALTNVRAKPLNLYSKGKKAKDTKKAKDMDCIEICMESMPGNLVPVGNEDFYVLILLGDQPIGIGDQSSGTFRDASNGQEVRYTFKTAQNYNQDAQNYCIRWKPAEDVLKKGMYKVIIWNRGRKAGECGFNLK